ncbi:MAG: TerL protein [Acidobacteriia bacterium]|nr:TerL protein [Terriglobia bacterium]
MIWPPDYTGEFKRRIKMLEVLGKDPVLRVGVMAYYRDNPKQWINDWCMTFDPRIAPPDPRWVPFILFPRQEQFIDFVDGCFKDKESGLAEKARDMGVTWECVCYSVHAWLFFAGTAIGWGSRKEEYVDDKDDPKAIFTKVRQLLANLPLWMLPRGFDFRKHATYMKIINPENGSSITGEAGDNIGRGGRTTIYFKDESAHYERPESIEAALGDNTDVQIDISSVNGSANVFYRRRMAGEVWEPGKVMPKGVTRVFVFDWRDHPGKTQEWYDRRRDRADREGLLHLFAQEVDRDYSGSVVGVIIKQEWVRAAIDAHIKLAKLGDWFAGERIAMQDIADGGGDKNAYISRKGVVMQRADHWGGDAGDAAKIAVPYAIEDGVHELYYDSIGVGAGFKAATNTMQEQPSWPRSLRVMQWNAAASPLDPTDHVIPGDDQSPTNEDQYGNLKVQSWFRVRTRFWKTYLAVTRGQIFDPAEMISLPSDMTNLHQVCMELSQAVKKTGTNGKTIVDKKPDGSLSPNLADAAIGCYCPTRETSILDVL